jgi:hypothetical protein
MPQGLIANLHQAMVIVSSWNEEMVNVIPIVLLKFLILEICPRDIVVLRVGHSESVSVVEGFGPLNVSVYNEIWINNWLWDGYTCNIPRPILSNGDGVVLQCQFVEYAANAENCFFLLKKIIHAHIQFQSVRVIANIVMTTYRWFRNSRPGSDDASTEVTAACWDWDRRWFWHNNKLETLKKKRGRLNWNPNFSCLLEQSFELSSRCKLQWCSKASFHHFQICKTFLLLMLVEQYDRVTHQNWRYQVTECKRLQHNHSSSFL